jgi:hypothetical protein
MLAICALRARALPVQVAFDWPAGNPTSTTSQIHIYAIKLAGNAASATVEVDADPNGVNVNLDDGVWQLQATAPGYWSQGAEVAVGGQSSAGTRIALWPAALLHGEIVPAQGGPPPNAIEIRLSATTPTTGGATAPQMPPTGLGSSPPQAELRCPIDKGSWSCVGPSGLFDVRMEVAGFAPRYQWNVVLKTAENVDLGRTELQQTASVFGRAVRKDGSDPPGTCQATLRPDVDWRSGLEPDPDRAPAEEQSFSVALSKHGYFQVVGVMPGRHVLSVDCPEASGILDLIVQANVENRIDPPLQLEELTLDIGISPKLDPAGQPWQLTVEETAPRLRRFADKAAASQDGQWTRRGLMAGNYHISVYSADGTTWLQRNFDLSSTSSPLLLHLASERVSGHVLLSSEPVGAKLVFTNDKAGASTTFTSAGDGRYQGVLPVEPGVPETTWNVEAHVTRPAVSRTLIGIDVAMVAAGTTAILDLPLPTIAVRGVVVSEDGRLQRGAQVTFEEQNGAQSAVSTDESGAFELPDLAPGNYTAVAQSQDGVSDRTPFSVVQGMETVLKLIFHPSLKAVFYVSSDDGPVSDAAVQVWIPPGVPSGFARTDKNGKFTVKLPPGTAQVGLTVGASGYALKLTRMPVVTDPNAPPDASTVMLSRAGGTLDLNFDPPEGTLDPAATLYLVHDGAIQDARTVAGWGTDQAGTSGDGPAEVDAIEPGNYALCISNGQSDITALWQGPPPDSQCSEGAVKQNETLTLTVK